ncbi:MAG: molybdopterin synthase subunit MoaD / molybdopterin synthase subunit MoaE [Myxococcaceae bacterium]|nr:molybdopterin synthase subunit MoaD / molybdopterin synthase subunit MoaE [Myxococcaceae bacterium]
MADHVTVRLLCFAAARELVGAAELAWTVPAGATVAALRASLFARYPALAGHARSLRFAVNGEYAKDDRLLGAGDEVAVIPPVAGG